MQSSTVWRIAILAFAFYCVPLPTSGRPSSTVASYNARPIGSPGLRHLELQLKSGARVTRRFDITHAWRQDGAETRSLVFLERPIELRGTSYLWIEGGATPGGLQVFLRLPAAQRRVLAIVPSRFDEGLLGSDFAYSDLLWQIPTSGRRLHQRGAEQLDGVDVRIVDSEPAGAASALSTSWTRIRYFVSTDGRALLGADYYDRTEAEDRDRPPAKRLRTFDWTDRGGVLVPSRMVMSVGTNRSSELILKSVRLDVPGIERGLFEPDVLGELADGFERGAPHPRFRGHDR